MKNKCPNEKKQRHIEFLRLFDTVPGVTKVDRIRWVAEKLDCAENTVRIFLMKAPPRVPTRLAMRVIADELRRVEK